MLEPVDCLFGDVARAEKKDALRQYYTEGPGRSWLCLHPRVSAPPGAFGLQHIPHPSGPRPQPALRMPPARPVAAQIKARPAKTTAQEIAELQNLFKAMDRADGRPADQSEDGSAAAETSEVEDDEDQEESEAEEEEEEAEDEESEDEEEEEEEQADEEEEEEEEEQAEEEEEEEQAEDEDEDEGPDDEPDEDEDGNGDEDDALVEDDDDLDSVGGLGDDD
jgi:hypothetical protein